MNKNAILYHLKEHDYAYTEHDELPRITVFNTVLEPETLGELRACEAQVRAIDGSDDPNHASPMFVIEPEGFSEDDVPDLLREDVIGELAKNESVTVNTIASKYDVSVDRARSVLDELVESGEVAELGNWTYHLTDKGERMHVLGSTQD